MLPRMKLLKFVNGDAPQTFVDANITATRLSFKSRKLDAPLAKSWALTSTAAATAPVQGGGCYWLLDENNKPIALLDNIVLAVPDTNTNTVASTPCGVTDEAVKGVDLRSRLGRQLERARAEYGITYKTASKSAREMMDAEEVTEKRNEKMKRDRETVAEAVESGEGIPAVKQPKAKKSKKE